MIAAELRRIHIRDDQDIDRLITQAMKKFQTRQGILPDQSLRFDPAISIQTRHTPWSSMTALLVHAERMYSPDNIFVECPGV